MTILALSVSGQFIEFIGAKSSEESLSNSQASDKSQPNQLEPDRKQSVKKFWVKDPKKKKKSRRTSCQPASQRSRTNGTTEVKLENLIITYTHARRQKDPGARIRGTRIYGYRRTDAMFL